MNKLLVATDFSELARQAYVAAASLAKAYDAQIHLVYQAEPQLARGGSSLRFASASWRA